jgi:mono/diheme cytochrome c family protein
VPEQNRQLPKPAPVTANADAVQQGQVLYQRHCSYCHGDGMRTGGLTPDLRYAGQAVHDSWQNIVLGGVLEARGMVSFAPYLDATEAEAIRQYVLMEANKRYARQQSSADKPAQTPSR